MSKISSFEQRCREVLQSNDRGRHTVPSATLYPHQWAWDSAFAAIGWSTIDTSRALDELESLLDAQWDDGRVPAIAYDPEDQDYFPGPDLWEADGRSSSVTQPPAWAIALEVILRRGGDRERIAALVPAMDRSLAFFSTHRDPLGSGGVAVAHPWESGRDNCPAWDAALAVVDPARAPEFRRRDKNKVADATQRPTDDHYKRYVVLVKAMAADGFGQGEFAVYDPWNTAIRARSERALERVAGELGVEVGCGARAAASEAWLERHWDAALGRCSFLDARSGETLAPHVLAAYAPGFAGPSELASVCDEGLRGAFATPWRLSTTATLAPERQSRCYWRGPVWISMNWLYATSFERSFGAELAQHTLQLIDRGGMHEYFDPDTGEGLGVGAFTWTAALALDLLARGYRP